MNELALPPSGLPAGATAPCLHGLSLCAGAGGIDLGLESERERFLSKDEIGRLAEALDAAEDQRAATIMRMCLLTGARVGEVRKARFEQFNLELGSWSKPATTTKQRKVHRLPISDEVAAIPGQPTPCPLS